MAKRILTVPVILAVLSTGLSEDDAKAFEGYLSAELGAYKAKLSEGEAFGGLTLKGKGDKAKGTFDGGRVEFTGGHNVATLCIHFACLVYKQADSLGVIPPRVDVSSYCSAWADRRRVKATASAVAA